ncbi:MAG: hypothetical protein IKQ39_00835 [Oscillospiraceae bacterium]|nr:hypothetical protein [Oscillospiraceae bacterium]
MAELQRLLFSPKRLITLLLIAVVNLALFSGNCRSEREQNAAYYERMRSWGVFALQEEQRATEHYLTVDYPNYLELVQSQSQSQSVLGKLSRKNGQNDFISRNLEKTAEDYRRLGKVTLQDGENRGIRAVMNYDLTDILLLLAPLLLVLELSGDAATAVGALTRSTKRGRVPLTVWRMLAVVLLSALDILVLYGGNIAYTWYFYGNPGISRAVQSLPEFQYCPYRLSIGGFFLCTALLKLLALTVIALLVWVLLARLHPILGWSISGAALGSMYLLHTLVLPTARFNHFRFLNVFAALEADEFYTEYLNLNWFSHPSGFLADMLAAVLLMLAVMCALTVILIGRCRPARLGQGAAAVQDRLKQMLTRFLPLHTRFGFEGWKLLIAQKAVLILAAAALMGVSLWKEIQIYAPVMQETKTMYASYQGEVTKENIQKLAKRTAFLADLVVRTRKQLDEASLKEKIKNQICKKKGMKEEDYLPASSKRIETIERSLEQYTQNLSLHEQMLSKLMHNARYTAETGRPAWIVPEESYQILFNESASERRCCMVLLLFLIFAFSSVGAFDNRYDTLMLLRSTKHGRLGMRSRQMIWIALLSAVASVGLHGIYLVHVYRDVRLPMLEAPAQSIAYLQWIPVSVSLKTAVIGFMVLRFLAAFLLACGVFCISRFSRTPQKALLLAMVVFLLPAALAESGVPQFSRLDFIRFLSCCRKAAA